MKIIHFRESTREKVLEIILEGIFKMISNIFDVIRNLDILFFIFSK